MLINKLECEQHWNDNGQLVYESYFFNRKLHREDGPAYQRWNKNGRLVYEEYWLNGELHREDGPAYREWDDNGRLIYEEYWLNGKKVAKADLHTQSCDGKVVEIDGKRYKLLEIA